MIRTTFFVDGVEKRLYDLRADYFWRPGSPPNPLPLMDEEWKHRCQLADRISTAVIEGMLSRAHKAGALGGKACGAGGGGSLAFIVPEGARSEVEQALEDEGARILRAHPVEVGHSLEVEP